MENTEIRTKEALIDALSGHDGSQTFALTGSYHMITLPRKSPASGVLLGTAATQQFTPDKNDNRGSYTTINGEKIRVHHQLISTYQLDQYNTVGKVLAMLTRVDKVSRMLSE